MDSSEGNAVPLAPQQHTGVLGSPSRRRPALLIGLLAALVILLVRMPAEARDLLWAGLIAQRALLSLLFVFMLVALSLVWSAGQRLDSRIFLFFNLSGYHAIWLDDLMWLITQLGNMLTAFASAAVLFGLGQRRLAMELVVGTISLWLFVETIKLLTDRARPFLVLETTRIIGRRESGRSFPSGHTSQIFFMAALLSHLLHPSLPVILGLYAIAMLVGFTRIYVGAHYPRDVMAGALLGSLWGILGALLDPYWLVFGL